MRDKARYDLVLVRFLVIYRFGFRIDEFLLELPAQELRRSLRATARPAEVRRRNCSCESAGILLRETPTCRSVPRSLAAP
jgi:hypothetical protein